MHPDRYEFCRPVVDVEIGIDLAKLDDLCIGQRGGVLYELDKFAGL